VPQIMTTKELAKYLKLHEITICKYAAEGRIPEGVPDGEYVVIRFETSFENKKSAIETVTPMLDQDGKWRVSGYFIK